MKNKLIIITVICIFVLIYSVSNCKSIDNDDDNGLCHELDGHNVSEDGSCHKEGLYDPLNNCVECHGPDLTGTENAPSCYKCHGKEW